MVTVLEQAETSTQSTRLLRLARILNTSVASIWSARCCSCVQQAFLHEQIFCWRWCPGDGAGNAGLVFWMSPLLDCKPVHMLLAIVFCFLHPLLCVRGNGHYPHEDAWGRAFSADYMPHGMALAGKQICGEFRSVLDGFQADWEFYKVVFQLDSSLVCTASACYVFRCRVGSDRHKFRRHFFSKPVS